MAQFDIHENPNIAQRPGFPYLVQLQNDQLDLHSTRLVMPLVRLPAASSQLPPRLAQPLFVDGETLYLAAHLCAPSPARLLRQPVASAREQSGVLLDALDAIINGV